MPYATKKLAVIFLFQNENKYLFLKRAHTGACDGFYMLPGGHVDEGETILDAAVREMQEELAVTVNKDDLNLALIEVSKTHVHFFFKIEKYTGVLKNNEPEKHDDMAFLPLEADGILPAVRKEIKSIENGITFMETNDGF